MSFPLFKATFRNNWFLVVIFTVISLLYLIMILGMYNAEMLEAMEASLKMIPGELASAVGMEKLPVDITDFAASYFYGFLIQLFVVIHVSILPLRLVVKYVDDGSMSYFLSTPNNRRKVLFTQILYMAFSLLAMMILICGAGIAFCAVKNPGALNIPAFVSLNFTAFLAAFAMASIVFFFSCLFNEYGKAAGVGVGILGIMFIFTLIGRVGHQKGAYGVFGNLSILRFINGRAIVAGEVNMILNNLALILISLIFLFAGYLVFQKKDLSL